MKRLYSILAATILFGTAIPAAKAAIEVSVDFFHDNLEPYGDWREVGDYGYVWQPRDVDRDWRPYSDGRWLYTDAGWTWDSDEPYSWAVYHYGRWARVDRVGWVWVPGTEWGPAWVSWRRSERHVGWAPLPPEARFVRTVGFSFGVDVDFDIGPANYRFVQVRDFGEPRLRRHFVEPRQNITIINQTTNITNITYVNNVVYNQGPRYDVIARESAQPIRRLKLDRRDDFDREPGVARDEQFRSRVKGDSFRVVAPVFDAKPATAPKRFVAKVEKAEVDRGWKDAGPPDAVAKLRTKIKSEPAPAPEPPPQAKKDTIAEPPVPTPGKAKEDDKPPKPAVPAKPDVAPVVPEKPAAPDRPTKPGIPPRPSPPDKEETAPPTKPDKETETPRKPAEAPTKVKAPGRKTDDAAPKRKGPPATEKRIQPDKDQEPPKPRPAGVRKPVRDDSEIPKPRPNANEPVPAKPVIPEATPAQPTKEKRKGRKKDEGKTEEPPK